MIEALFIVLWAAVVMAIAFTLSRLGMDLLAAAIIGFVVGTALFAFFVFLMVRLSGRLS